jgi:hypothetical protein
MYPLTVGRADTSRLEMPIVKVDVHAPIFYFPKKLKTERVTGKEETLNYV